MLSFTSEAIENIPAGWRARETYVEHGPDEVEKISNSPGRTNRSRCITVRDCGTLSGGQDVQRVELFTIRTPDC
jgi:hypothetical protein